MRPNLWAVIPGIILWLLVLAAVGGATSVLAISCAPTPPEHRYKYIVWQGGAAFAVGSETDHYKIGADGTLTWVTKSGRTIIASSGSWRVEEQAP